MVEKVFLTDKRREVLNGKSDLDGQSLANEKYRIRERAKTALEELEAIAQSMEIENESVFEPEAVGRLVFWITQDPANVENMTKPKDEWDPFKTYTESQEQYMKNLYFQINKQLDKIDKPDEGF